MSIVTQIGPFSEERSDLIYFATPPDRTVRRRTVRSDLLRYTARSDRSPKNGPIFHLTPLFQHQWRNQVIRYIYLVDGFKGRATTKPGHDIIAKQMGLLLR